MYLNTQVLGSPHVILEDSFNRELDLESLSSDTESSHLKPSIPTSLPGKAV